MAADSLPLLAHDRPDAIVAYRTGVPISARRFLFDAQALARRLPDRYHIINLCADRYRFAVVLAAGLLARRCNLLPPGQTPGLIRQLGAFAADACCVTDDPDCALEVPLLFFHEGDTREPAPAQHWSIPLIDGADTAACIFTSGSTGEPVPHRKSWGALARSVRHQAARISALAPRGCALLGTVPPQHMYGFESTVLLPLQSGGALCTSRPFFPADIAAALARLPRPRALITTPVHLRSLVRAEIALAGLDLIVSATAMLPRALAVEVEQRYQAPLLEIYGSTETGQLASRRPTREADWQLWPGVHLDLACGRERCHAFGGHLEQPTPLADVIEPRGADRFVLHGRGADQVNIAGKRSSLAYLTQQLNAIPGVLDGAYFVPEEDGGSIAGVTRLAALVVAPRLDVPSILRRLRERIDPVFLPRPLLRVEALPRNATGKLPQRQLRELVAQATDRTPDLLA